MVRRAVVVVIGLLCLGVVTSVGVAWACAVHYQRTRLWSSVAGVPPPKFSREVDYYCIQDSSRWVWECCITRESIGHDDVIAVLLPLKRAESNGLGPPWSPQTIYGNRRGLPYVLDGVFGLDLDESAQRVDVLPLPRQVRALLSCDPCASQIELTGWPMAAMFNHSGLASTWSFPSQAVGTRQFLGYVLPLLPLWSGLVVDAAFYGAAWSLLFLAYRTLHRALSRQRGVCASCRYDLAGLPISAGGVRVCPECGTGDPATE
jgi:hypothetical protein